MEHADTCEHCGDTQDVFEYGRVVALCKPCAQEVEDDRAVERRLDEMAEQEEEQKGNK